MAFSIEDHLSSVLCKPPAPSLDIAHVTIYVKVEDAAKIALDSDPSNAAFKEGAAVDLANVLDVTGDCVTIDSVEAQVVTLKCRIKADNAKMADSWADRLTQANIKDDKMFKTLCLVTAPEVDIAGKAYSGDIRLNVEAEARRNADEEVATYKAEIAKQKAEMERHYERLQDNMRDLQAEVKQFQMELINLRKLKAAARALIVPGATCEDPGAPDYEGVYEGSTSEIELPGLIEQIKNLEVAKMKAVMDEQRTTISEKKVFIEHLQTQITKLKKDMADTQNWAMEEIARLT